MPIVERMQWPRKFKLKDTLLLLVLLGAAFGIWYNGHTQKQLLRQVIIHGVKLEKWGTNYVEVGFDIENTGSRDQDVRLLVKVYDAAGEEIASAVFMNTVRAATRANKSRMLDKMTRTLKDGEVPYRATIEILTRKVM